MGWGEAVEEAEEGTTHGEGGRRAEGSEKMKLVYLNLFNKPLFCEGERIKHSRNGLLYSRKGNR